MKSRKEEKKPPKDQAFEVNFVKFSEFLTIFLQQFCQRHNMPLVHIQETSCSKLVSEKLKTMFLKSVKCL